MDIAFASPQISVIVAAYNAVDTLTACIESVQAQDVTQLEILIIDDASKDKTLELAEQLAQKDARIRVLRAPVNGGPAAARNIGLDAATGVWMAVMDSDDVILPGRFSAMVRTANETAASIIFDNLFHERHGLHYSYVPAGCNIFGPLLLEVFIRSHRRCCNIPNLGFLKPLIRRDVLEKNHTRYDRRLLIGEDALLIMELMADGAKAILMPDAYYQYERREGSISSRQNAESIRSITSAYENLQSKGRLSKAESETLTSLIADNLVRIKAKECVESFPKAAACHIMLQSLINPALAKGILRELASSCKNKLKK